MNDWEGLPHEGIPAIAELGRYPQWVCFKLVPRKDSEKFDKIPYDPKTGHKASSVDSRTWAPLSMAIQACQDDMNYAGVGFVLTELDPFVGVDLDDCVKDPNKLIIEDWAKEWIEKLGSYTEISVSGKGLRIITKGLVELSRKKKGSIEVYQDKRFLTITGNHFEPWKKTIETTADRLKGIFGSDDPKKASVTTAEAKRLEDLTKELTPYVSEDAEPSASKLDALFENSPEFKLVWDHEKKGTEDWSQSEWDLSIMNYLMDATWPKEEIVAALIMQRRRYSTSKLMRPDYYARTFVRAERGREAQEAQDNLTKEALEEVKEEEKPEFICNQLSEIYGFKFIRIIKYMSDPPTFAIVTELGSVQGPINILINQISFRAAIAQACGIVVSMVKARPWDLRSQSMLNILTKIEVGEEATSAGFGRGMITQYLENRPPPKPFDLKEADRGNPYTDKGGAIVLFSHDFGRFLSRDLSLKIPKNALGITMRQAGCTPGQKGFKVGDKRFNRAVWRLPDNFLEEEGEE